MLPSSGQGWYQQLGKHLPGEHSNGTQVLACLRFNKEFSDAI